MGYLTDDLIASSSVFVTKVTMSLVKLVRANLNSQNSKHKLMSRVVMSNVNLYALEVARLLSLDGLDLDSSDASIDAGLLTHLDWLVARTIKDMKK